MNGKTKLRIDSLSVQAGNRQPDSASIHILVAPSRRSHRTRGSLYILIETSHGLAAPKPFYGDLARTVADSYYELSGSVTRALRAALLAANDLLYERNVRADTEHQVVVGLDCVVIRQDDIYIGQLGPALVNLVHNGELFRYPADSVWLRTPNPGAYDLTREPPAGLRRASEPNLYHATLSPGDVLILSTTDLARIGSDRDLLDVVALAEDQSVRENLERLARGYDLDALLIECPGERRPSLQPVEARARADVRSPEAARQPTDLEVAKVRARDGSEPDAQRGPAWGGTPAEDQSLAEDEPGSDEAEGEWEDYEGQPKGAAQPWIDFDSLRESVTWGAERVRRGAEELLVRVLPDASPEPLPRPRRQATGLTLSGRAFVIVVMAIPLVAFLLVVIAGIQYRELQRRQLDNIVAEVQTLFDQAMREESEGKRRQLLLATLDVVEDGLSIDSDHDMLNRIKRRGEHELDRLDRVARLYYFWQLASLEDDAISPTDSSRIVIHGIDVFILNRGSDRVYKFLLNDAGDAFQPLDSDPILVQKGEVRGGVQLGDMVDIAWMQAGGHRTLSTFMALERAGTLLAYDPQQGIDALPVANSDLWLNPQAIGGYFGNLYVLDPLLSRILKYVPTDNAYTNPPSDYMSPQLDVDLTGVVDMTIDGNLYVLFADGRILKLYDGKPQPFPMNGLPTSMRSPTTIFVSGPQEPDAEGYVYVTDTGNQRILQFDKAGNYIRQLKAKSGEPQMEQLRGIYVDEESKRMFILSGRILWLADIPPIGAE